MSLWYLGTCTSLRGGPRWVFTFSLFLIEENFSYQDLFSKWKNIVRNLSYRILKSRKYIHCARELKSRNFPKINLKIYLLLQFLRWSLDTWLLCSRDQYNTFNQSYFWFRRQKWRYRILSFQILHFWWFLAGWRHFSAICRKMALNWRQI